MVDRGAQLGSRCRGSNLSFLEFRSARRSLASAPRTFRREGQVEDESSRVSRPPQPPAIFRNLDKLREGGGRVRNEIEVIGYVKPGSRAKPPNEDDNVNDGTRMLVERYGLSGGQSGGSEDEDGEYEDNEGEDDEDEDNGEDEEGALLPETADELKLRSVYTTPGRVVPRFIGSVQVAALKGKGRGLITTCDVSPGDLLLVCAPLAVLFCDDGNTPENEELADYMLEKVCLTAAQHKILGLLAKSDTAGAASSHTSWSASLTMSDFNAASTTASGKPSTPEPTSPITIPREELYRIVNYNCIGEEFQDIAAYAMREEASSGHIGLWPEASMINHSCSPNSTHYVIGDRLLVHATDDIPSGTEVTLNWIGQELTRPLPFRQKELQEKLGFKCACARCRAESKYSGTELEEMIVETSEFCKELSPFLDTAIEEEDMDEIQDIRSDLETRKNSFEAAMRAAKVSSKAKKWLQASVYDLYDLISLCADEGAELQTTLDQAAKQKSAARGGRDSKGRGHHELLLDTEALAVCTRLVEGVAKGSDAQLYLSAELMVRTASKFGTKHEEHKQAAKMCHDAFRSHYGPISENLLDELAEARLSI